MESVTGNSFCVNNLWFDNESPKLEVAVHACYDRSLRFFSCHYAVKTGIFSKICSKRTMFELGYMLCCYAGG